MEDIAITRTAKVVSSMQLKVFVWMTKGEDREDRITTKQ